MKKSYEAFLLLSGEKPVCKTCIHFCPDIGHGGHPGPHGPCKRTMIRRYTSENDTCKHFSILEK